jgi:hypothetical protein
MSRWRASGRRSSIPPSRSWWAVVEDGLGLNLDDPAYVDRAQEPYIIAETVETPGG